jgi:transcription elongation factor Elf1
LRRRHGTQSLDRGGIATPCGTLSTAINTVYIQVYTTRIGIGVNGSTTNCGTRNLAFEVDVKDQNIDAACAVNMPHFIAARNTAPDATTSWAVNSTLVRCINQVHTFDVRLWDTKTGETLATTTVSATVSAFL